MQAQQKNLCIVASPDLHLAAWHEKIEIAKYVIENGADINAINVVGSTCFLISR